MEWKLIKSRPICPQLCEQLSTHIALGEFAAGEQLPSVRALEAGVNPGTVQKAFEQLSRDGIIYAVVGSGWYVGDNLEAAEAAVMMMTTGAERAMNHYNAKKKAE